MAIELCKKGPEQPILMWGLHVEIIPGMALHDSDKYLKTSKVLNYVIFSVSATMARKKREKGKNRIKKSQSTLGHYIGQ